MFLLIPLVLAFQPDPDILRKIYQDAVLRREADFGPNNPRTAAAARDLGFFLREKGDRKSPPPPSPRRCESTKPIPAPIPGSTLADLLVLPPSPAG